MNQGPAYFGDLDETDGRLLEFEMKAEEEGESPVFKRDSSNSHNNPSEWMEAYANLREALGLPADDPIPTIPGRPSNPPTTSQQTAASHKKRKITDGDGDAEMSSDQDAPTLESDVAKRLKSNVDNIPPTTTVNANTSDTVLQNARAAAAYIPFLDVDNLLPPKMPTREEMEQVLLRIRKQMLMEEYFGDNEQKVS
jgi:pre-mRNA-splicing factor ISY1